jgi:transcriptional regulator with XRE-family HTH domain
VDKIGKRIRSARKDAGLSQEALARMANMSLNGMASIERGEIVDPHISTLAAIADALDVSVGELLEEPALAPKALAR